MGTALNRNSPFASVVAVMDKSELAALRVTIADLNGAVLGIVDDAADGSEDGGVGE